MANTSSSKRIPIFLAPSPFFDDFKHSPLCGIITQLAIELLHPGAGLELEAFPAVLDALLFAAYPDFAVPAFRIVPWEPTAAKTALSVHQPILIARHETAVGLAAGAIGAAESDDPLWRKRLPWQLCLPSL